MEIQELERILEKLEKIEIHNWKFVYEPTYTQDFLIAETNGLKFSIEKKGDSARYTMNIENIEEGLTNKCFIYHSFGKKEKPQREMLARFYEKKTASLKEYKERIIKEKLEYFLSE